MTEKKCPLNEPFCHAGCALWSDGKTCLERVLAALLSLNPPLPSVVEPKLMQEKPIVSEPVMAKKARRRKVRDGNSEQV